MLQKPHWLKTEEWNKLLQACGGIPRCAVTGKTDDLSIDHIVPRYHGGTDDASNLQFLEKSLNCRKGVQDDQYWAQTFYFDRLPNLSNCRSAQTGLYNAIIGAADWFSEPASAIARLLYLAAIVVGGGKTIAPVIMACAYNAIMHARWGAVRRTDRLLILCKERAIRDQIARDLKRDIVNFGILPTPPRVLQIKHGWQFTNEGLLMSNDIIVSCIQQIWENQRGLGKILNGFPMIVLDEPHFGPNKVRVIIEEAATSVCFGVTGTPIDGAGKLLPRMINIFCFGYHDADSKDHSLKYLNDGNLDQFIKIATLDSATMLNRGQVSTRNDTEAEGYGKNFEPAKSVAWEVILQMERCDQLGTLDLTNLAKEPKAPHRQKSSCEVSIFYPIHALICCDNVRFANHLCATINDLFENEPGRFPREKGWRCEVVHCEGEEPDGKPRPDKPLLPDHPWMRAKEQPGYRIDRSCARLLCVVGMGREGVNNPLCGLVGLTSDHASQVEGVQRIMGRQLRSVTVIKEDGTLCVPPALLDTVTIITHDAFKEVLPTLESCIDFIMNMEDHLQGLPTILNLQRGEEPDDRKVGRDDVSIPFRQRLQVVGIMGGNPTIEPVDIITGLGGNTKNPKGNERLVDWINLVRTDSKQARRRLGLDVPISTVQTVLLEQVERIPTDEQLSAFLRAKSPHLANRPINDQTRDFVRELFVQHAAGVNASTPNLFNPDGERRNIEHIRKNIGGSILAELGEYFVRTQESNRELWSKIGIAVKMKLGVPHDEKAQIGSQWDIPNCHMILERSEVQREIKTYVISQMIDAGYCPNLAALQK